jgi:hypothetical protein
MVYATVAKGYRPGGSNSPAATADPGCLQSAEQLGLKSVPTTFSSDRLWSYEIGAKDSMFDHRLAVQASAYYIDWTNIQTEVSLPSCENDYTANRGKAISQGFDLQVAAVLAEGLKVNANVGYTDAYYPNATYGLPGSPGSTPPLLTGAGDKLGGPPWTANTMADYSFRIDPIWNRARAYTRVDVRWLSGDPERDPRVAGYRPWDTYPDQAYGLLNLRLGVLWEGLDVSVFSNNTTNSNPKLLYKSDDRYPSTFTPLFYGVALPPRTIGVTALYRF